MSPGTGLLARMPGDGIAELIGIAQRQAAGRDTIVLPPLPVPGDGPPPPPGQDPGRARPPLLPWMGQARPGPVPLLAVLTGQAVFALHLAGSNTAFSDEALYLWAGHLEWAHLLHGTPLPAFPAYFSGAPVIYPPLGALADAAGGLAGARVLSLLFMLGATVLLWATTSRLHGKTAGFFAAALWAFLGPTLHLSAFATYDAMALFLLALGAWCAVRAGGQRDAAGWLFAAAAAMALANATAYSSALFDPVIVAVALLASTQRAKAAAMRAAAVSAYTAALVVLAATAGGGLYYAGIAQTVLNRVAGNNPAPLVLAQALAWTAPVVVPALAAAVLGWRTGTCRRRRAMLGTLAAAALLAPVEQARLHTGTSLDKHADVGAWFAAIAAGWLLAELPALIAKAPWQKAAATGALAALLVLPVSLGLAQARALFAAWPNVTPFITVLSPLMAHTRGQVLVETSPIAEYYLPQGSQWTRWSSTFAIMFRSGHGRGPGVGQVFGSDVYSPLIHGDYFSLVALNFGSASAGLDREIAGWLDHERAYQLVATVPYGPTGHYSVWERR